VDTRSNILTIPGSTRFLEEVRAFIAGHALRAGLDEARVDRLKMAVDEACTNVIEHAYGGESEQRIEIAVIARPDRLMIRIRDTGKSFDQEAYNEPDLLQYAKRRKSGGLGVHIMRKLTDEVTYRSTRTYNECCLTTLLGGRHGDS